MALRNVVVKGDEILGKKCRAVDEINERMISLLDDMIETMHDNNGVGIAAPQVGMLKRACIMEPEEGKIYELINPEIVSREGEQEGYEGCLSVPGYIGYVKRPAKVKVKSLNRKGEVVEYEFEEFAAVVACHEIDHLDGILYTDKATDIHVPVEGE